MKRFAIAIFFIIFCIISYESSAQKKLPTINYTKAFKDKKLTKITIGESSFTTGEILVGDPFLNEELSPMVKRISPGTYPIDIMVQKVKGQDYYKVAFAILKVKSEAAVNWELAITKNIPEESIAKLARDGFFGFESKSQLASFFDTNSYKKFNKEKTAYYKKYKNRNFYTDFLAAEFKAFSGSNKYSLEIGDWNMHKVDKSTIIPMISTGGHEGKFPVYWGLNRAGEIVECVIDFFVYDLK